MAIPEMNAVVSQRVEVAPGLIILRVRPKGWDLPDFTPGQYTVLGLPGDAPRSAGSEPEETPPKPDRLIRRAYSIASSSVLHEYMEFYINIVTTGSLTPRLFALRQGDTLWLSPRIVGMFTLADVPDGQNLVMMATGTGLAPYMSMLRTDLKRFHDRKVAVIHGARHSCDLGYRSELITMARMCDWLTYIPCVTRPDQEPAPWYGRKGYLQDVWRDRLVERSWGFRPAPDNTHVFLCGNPKMVEDMMEQLLSERFLEHTRKQAGQIHTEKYW